MGNDLVEFLRARLGEDEAIADADAFPPPGYADAQRQARGARMLAEVEAKRQIIKLYERIDAESGASDPYQWAASEAPLSEVLQHLALPYADHPDYRQEWRPTRTSGLPGEK